MITLRSNPFEPMLASLKVVPPALTSGLLVFMTILFIVGVAVPGFNESLQLQKSTFTKLECELFDFFLFFLFLMSAILFSLYIYI